jgi:Cu2+-exporting ATPase
MMAINKIMKNNCLHCDKILEYNQKDFCCNGCECAYKIIQENNCENYYKSRIINPEELSLKPDLENQLDISELIKINPNGEFQIDLMIQGLHCGACIWLIENLLKKQQNVIDGRINLTQKTLRIKWCGDKNYGNNLIKLITQIGYKLFPADQEILKKIEEKFDNQIFKALAVAGFAVGNIMLFSFGLWFDNNFEIEGATRKLLHLLSSIIALPALIYSGRIFFISAFKSIKAGLPNMDVPISIAIFLASIVSLVQTFRGAQNVYFDSAIMLVFFLLIGRYLDFKARKKAFNVASEFSMLQAGFGRVEIDKKIRVLPIKELRENMILIVAVGEKIACDGIVIDGQSNIDNSLISGESIPEKVVKNSLVYGGSINLNSPLKIKITKNSENGVLSQIIGLIANIENKKNIYIRIADQFSKYYTPIVHILAFITFSIWYFYLKSDWEVALMNATAVLIITCPCALALAIPIAQTIAISNFLKKGIIMKNGESLEKINNITHVIFDKTGSLTIGKPILENTYEIVNGNLQELNFEEKKFYQKISASMAKFSKHPISQSLSNSFDGELENIEAIEHSGKGLEAEFCGKKIRLGSDNFCEIYKNNNNFIINNLQSESLANLRCFMNFDNKNIIFTFHDELKKDAKEVINFLKKNNKKVILLSGDSANEVRRIAKITDIEEFYWQKNPLEKTAILQSLKDKNINFMMIGDGLNDAPSLVLANVSISFSKAVDISQNIADIIINSSKLHPIISIFLYSKNTLKIMKQNLILALIYNIFALPFAMAGYVVPLIAAIAMSSSSLIVVINSLRLNSKNIKYL